MKAVIILAHNISLVDQMNMYIEQLIFDKMTDVYVHVNKKL